ncbi:MAG: hypothetical protein QOG64_591 [Acidimicrobiaceae bacterium]|jgi:hypothetical protein|nr:hypothetical protein [Acidimicrobiaceae bacterium]
MRAEELEQASAVRRGVTVWFAVFGGVAAWTFHLLVLASMARFTCNAPRFRWTMHLTTGVCVAATAVAMALSARLLRIAGDADDADASPGGRVHYLGYLGLAVGTLNLALILLEEVYSIFLYHCG